MRTLSHGRVFEDELPPPLISLSPSTPSPLERRVSLVDSVPLGLRNRRRIWGTVEEILEFVGEKKWVIREEEVGGLGDG